ncbi:hypothetical protein DIPPA_01693 [Diplonema papillatum]|nr:hypothetical protein DIPPA_01693 [Diplonema papillatum]|eukprot:gene3978-6170_t
MPQTGLFSSPRHLSDKEATQVAEDRKVNCKKMNNDEVAKSVARLTHVREKRGGQENLVRPVLLSKDSLDKSVDRLYTRAIAQKKATIEYLVGRACPTQERAVLSNDNMTESVNRIFTQAVQHKRELGEKLKQKHMVDLNMHNKKLTTEDQTACNQRAYTGPMQRRKETEDRLAEKYIASTERKFKTMGKSDWDNTVSRLAAAKS